MTTPTGSITTLVFDWDGTIADSASLGLLAFQKAFAELEVAFPLEIYEAAYSPNWYATYEALGLPRDKWQIADDFIPAARDCWALVRIFTSNRCQNSPDTSVRTTCGSGWVVRLRIAGLRFRICRFARVQSKVRIPKSQII